MDYTEYSTETLLVHRANLREWIAALNSLIIEFPESTNDNLMELMLITKSYAAISDEIISRTYTPPQSKIEKILNFLRNS